MLRHAIITAKCTRRGAAFPPAVIDLLAGQITSNARDLESAVDQTHTYITLMRLTAEEAAMRALKAMARINAPPPGSGRYAQSGPALARVIDVVARHYGLTADDLGGRKRTQKIALARHLAMFLARELTDASLPQIGEALGGRNHSTILHGCAKISDLTRQDSAFALEVATVRALASGARGPGAASATMPPPQQADNAHRVAVRGSATTRPG
jgi:chromosomal replication initiator protein